MPEAFDPLEALAKMAAASIDGTGRKLTLFDKCAAFACLYGGTKSSVVAKAFGLSSASVSYLAGCRPIDDRKPVTIAIDVRQQATDDKGYLLVEPPPDNKESFPPALRTPIMVTKTITETITPTNLNMRRSPDRKPRYQDVAREFDRLGEEMFLRTYYTADIDARIERIEQNRPRPGDDRTPFSFNPKADSHAGVHNFGLNQFGVEECIRIVCDPKRGWMYDGCNPDGSKLGKQWNWTYDDNDKPFRTSKAAYEHYLRFTNRMT
jgi:hypothetical protein